MWVHTRSKCTQNGGVKGLGLSSDGHGSGMQLQRRASAVNNKIEAVNERMQRFRGRIDVATRAMAKLATSAEKMNSERFLTNGLTPKTPRVRVREGKHCGSFR